MFHKFILWCYTTPILVWAGNSTYAIPTIQTFHLAGITTILGVVCILSIRLLGLGLMKMPLRTLWRELSRWFLGGLLLTVATGIIIAIIDPTRYLANTPFRIKMCCLAVAIVFHYTVTRRVARTAEDTEVPRTTPGHALVGVVSLLLWFSVGWAGRMIAFFM